MDWRININDMSSFFLFEASGDSEGDSDHFGDSEFLAMCNGFSFARDDDEESCSCDASVVLCSDDELDDDCEIEQDFSDSYMMRLSGATSEYVPGDEGEESSFRVGVDEGRSSTVMVMDEMERNRLFWETCLEIGHP
ncbi:uncharacterized protein LOC132270934 [Cornus florida]|uniref:uncharacterized protein LOC132270934 n=1 Tax=Cornus florida TaxID=4283 RepID=UPI0028A24968|nr:uncharacterized protein LOC132270934 [Cornus florida]